MFLDFFPQNRIRPPGVSRSLFRSQCWRYIAYQALIQRPELKPLAIGPNLYWLDAFAEHDLDTPHHGGGIIVAPGELWRNQVRGIDGPVRGNINVQAGLGAVRSEERRV